MKALFFSRSRREQYMLILFLLAMVLIWGSNLSDRAGAVSADRRTVENLLTEQRIILDDAENIEARMRAGIENLDPERTLDRLSLQGELNSIARRHGLNPDIPTPSSEVGEVFSYHIVNVTIRSAQMASLIAFAEEVQERTPYLGLEEVRLSPADRNDPRWLEARFTVSSVELSR